MKKLNVFAVIAVLALAVMTFGVVHAADKLKIGFIYVGPIGDLGYTYQHEVGRRALQKALNDKVETTYLENVPEGADAERAIEQLARAGNKLIFTTSFGFMDATVKVAAKYPNVFFEHATGFKRSKNLATYAARFYEGRYIQGQIAGKMTKSNIIGYIVSFPIPEVISGINATMLGAQSVNPKVKFKIIWVNSWFDPGKEADAAKALIDQGADVLTQHTDSPAAMQIAEQRGIHAFGQSSDMIKFGPKAQLTADTDYWGDYYIDRAKLVLDGKWKSDDTWDGLDKGMVVMASYTNMPDDVKQMAMKTEAAIKSGALHPFKCPIMDQSGKTVECKGGSRLDNGQILSMNWYVKGVDDKMPGQ
ncbi:MAG TPA: BMP family ABC transporter substrate-binding protein [Xanthobacteraceae bacterium]|nr:BMP family ABC transporter substrate-binding protein [Xanthobacteraceae bacterium]